MSYRLNAFEPDDGSGLVTFPIQEPTDDVSPAQARTQWLDLSGGGAFDTLGSETAPGEAQTLTKRCILYNEDRAQLQADLDDLKSLAGKKGKLYMQIYGGAQRWRKARCQITGQRPPATPFTVDIDLSFECESETWNSTQVTSNTDLDSTPKNISLTNSGNTPVKNAVITITIPADAPPNITKLIFLISGSVEFEYTGSLSSNDTLVIDTGARSVKKNGADDYGGNFSLTSNHAISEWLRLAVGANTLTVTVEPSSVALPSDVADLTGYATGLIGPPTYADGSITATKIDVQVDYYDQWR